MMLISSNFFHWLNSKTILAPLRKIEMKKMVNKTIIIGIFSPIPKPSSSPLNNIEKYYFDNLFDYYCETFYPLNS